MTNLAWHFVSDTLRDGRHVPADGVTLRHDGPLVICQSGLHWSERLIDALDYAPSHIVCRVRYGGEVARESDKGCSTERTILWRMDAVDVLRQFARLCALDVAHLWDMPDVVRHYLETGDESIRPAARSAAWAAWAACAGLGAAGGAGPAGPAWAVGAAGAAGAAWAAGAAGAAWAAWTAGVAPGNDRDAQNARLTDMIYAAAGRRPEDVT